MTKTATKSTARAAEQTQRCNNRRGLKQLPFLKDFIDELQVADDINGMDFLSALVNLVDTARENPKMFNYDDAGNRIVFQRDREVEIMNFLLRHQN